MTNARDSEIDELLAKNLELNKDPDFGSAAEAAALATAVKQIIKQTTDMEKSKAESSRKITKISLIGLCGAGVVIACLSLAITAILPLKEVTVVPVLIDKNTGETEIRKPGNDKMPPIPLSVDQAQLSKYVLARETYDWNYATENYNFVKHMSAPGPVFNDYDVFIKSKRSPLAVLGEKTRLKGKIISVTPMDDNVIQFRMVKTVVGSDGVASASILPTTWVITVKFDLPVSLDKATKGMTLDQRLDNPLFYQVTYYNSAQESSLRN